MPTYGNSANGTEGPGKIHAFNLNLFTTLSATKVNEFHATYLREDRPRRATDSNIPADTAIGFVPSFRFGAPFFLGPNVDELFQRFQLKDSFSLIAGNHTVKFGGDWTFSNNVQVFRGFFQSRSIFDSVTGFLRYASPASLGAGFGPNIKGCSNGSYVAASAACPAGSTSTGGPLLLYLQGAGLSGPATDAAGASNIDNEEYALFIQDKWQARRAASPSATASAGKRSFSRKCWCRLRKRRMAAFLNDPRFPSDGTLHDEYKMFQPRVGFAWDIANNSKSVLRASWGIYNARQNMLTQVGSITTNGVQQQTIFLNSDIISSGVPGPVWPNVVSPTPVPPGQFPLFSGVRVFSKDYRNPRIYSTNVQFEQQIAPDTALYLDFTHSKGVYLTRFLNANQNGIFSPQLGEVAVTSALGKSLYRGFTVGVRKRYSKGFQLRSQLRAVERPGRRFQRTRSVLVPVLRHQQPAGGLRIVRPRHSPQVQLRAERRIAVGLSGQCPHPGAQRATDHAGRAHDQQSATPRAKTTNTSPSIGACRNASASAATASPSLQPIEMFNSFNNDNLINPLTTVALFNFDGFLRQGVGDPRQVQLSLRFTF